MREITITQESFDALLDWLDSDRDRAGQKYELIRAGLIKIFTAKGFSDAEDLADLTINRVTRRLPDIRSGYQGEPVNYFHGVARNVLHEAKRRKEVATDVSHVSQMPLNETTESSDEVECLDKCLTLLPDHQRELILEYYFGKKMVKINRRKNLAQEVGLSTITLRVRAHRIRVRLQKCVLQCLKSSEMK